MEFRLSTKAGSAGDSTASTAAGSLGKYMSTRVIPDGVVGNLFDTKTGIAVAEGRTEYRCMFVLNDSGATIYGVKPWIASQVYGGADITIGIDPVGVTALDSATAQAAEIADEETAPTGVSFLLATTPATGPNVGTVADDECFAVWVRRRVPIGSKASAYDGALIIISGVTE